jgi:hypothetical protein
VHDRNFGVLQRLIDFASGQSKPFSVRTLPPAIKAPEIG